MGSNAARSVPIISWHRPAQRHLVPDLGAAAALPHEKKVGLGLISHPILLLTVCVVLYSKVKSVCVRACVWVSVCPSEMVDIYIREKVWLHLFYMCGWQPVLLSVLVIDSKAECCWEPGVSFCRAVTWTSVCHAGPFLSLTPTLRRLKQPPSHRSGPIQYDSPLYGQCGLRFSALRLFVRHVYWRFMFLTEFKKPLLTPHLWVNQMV